MTTIKGAVGLFLKLAPNVPTLGEEANKVLNDAKTLLAKVSAFVREKSSII